MANSPSKIDLNQSLQNLLATAISDGTFDDVITTPKIDQVAAAATDQSANAAQLWSNIQDDYLLETYQLVYKAQHLWQAADETARDGLGTGDNLVLDDLVWVKSLKQLWYCTSITGPTSSTWVRVQGGGSSGALNGEWRFSTNTDTGVDPGSGRVRFNNVTQGSATEMSLSTTTNGGTDVGALLKNLIGSSFDMYMQESSDSTRFHIVSINSAATDNGAWVSYTIVIDSSGSDINNNAVSTLAFFTEGGSSTPAWSQVLAMGANTGSTDPIISTGQKIVGEAELTLESNGDASPATLHSSAATTPGAAGGLVRTRGGAGDGSGAGGIATSEGGLGGPTGAGGASSTLGGAGQTSAAGGAATTAGGKGGNTAGTGGLGTVSGGPGGNTDGPGGTGRVLGGPGVGSADGGVAQGTAGAGGATGTGGAVAVTAGASGAANPGGAVGITGGQGGATDGTGGAVNVTGGASQGTAGGGKTTIAGGPAPGTGVGGTVEVVGGVPTAGQGGPVSLRGGEGATGGGDHNGGTATVLGGNAGPADGSAGNASLLGGTANPGGNSKSGDVIIAASLSFGSAVGGKVTVDGGNATNAVPGAVEIEAGTRQGTAGVGAAVTILGGGGVLTGGGGIVSITGGPGGASGAVGSAVNITAGDGSNTSPGGTMTCSGGDGGPSGGPAGTAVLKGGAAISNAGGGNANVTGGAGNGTGNGGTVNLDGGVAGATNADGGSIVLTPKAATGSGDDGTARVGTKTIVTEVLGGDGITATPTDSLNGKSVSVAAIVGGQFIFTSEDNIPAEDDAFPWQFISTNSSFLPISTRADIKTTSSSSLEIDILKGGVSVFASGFLTIAASGSTATKVPLAASISADTKLTVNIEAGSAGDWDGLTISFQGRSITVI